MMIIRCDFHPSWQQVSWLGMETGETGERKLLHADGEAERFYRQVAAPALIGMEATGNSHWLMDLLSDLGYELWVGMRSDSGELRGQQKTDNRDAVPDQSARPPRFMSGLPCHHPFCGHSQIAPTDTKRQANYRKSQEIAPFSLGCPAQKSVASGRSSV
jgi:hypothetical protein